MLPSFASVFPTGIDIPNLVQFNIGSGNPTAWQVCRSVESSFGVTSDGGVEVKIVRPTKTNLYLIVQIKMQEK